MRSAFKGGPLRNEAAYLVDEYSKRKRLAKLGYTSPLGELSAFRADVYAIIDQEIDACQQREMKAKKHGR